MGQPPDKDGRYLAGILWGWSLPGERLTGQPLLCCAFRCIPSMSGSSDPRSVNSHVHCHANVALITIDIWVDSVIINKIQTFQFMARYHLV